MSKISNRIYDEPPKNSVYPYVVMGDVTEIPDNRHNQLGYDVMATLYIHTKPGRSSFKPAKQILEDMNTVLNMKTLSMEGGFTMIICKYENSETKRDGDKRIISVRYRVIAH